MTTGQADRALFRWVPIVKWIGFPIPSVPGVGTVTGYHGRAKWKESNIENSVEDLN